MNDQKSTSGNWDLQAALINTDNRVEDLKELLEIWLRQAPKLLSEIRIALECGDAEKLHLAAHTLKGSLQIICADQACQTAFELEDAGQKSQIAIGHNLLAKLEQQITHLQPQLVQFLNAKDLLVAKIRNEDRSGRFSNERFDLPD